jgi:uncharacterized protein YdhG (YjbR/CyaY superfamily)
MATKTATTKASTNSRVDDTRWTDDEIAAMKAHAEELKTAKRRGASADKAAEGEADVLAKIADMNPSDRAMAERIHAIVKASAPELESRTWYGMPAYTKGGKVVCFFKAAGKFDDRYASFGFESTASLDEGSMWPTSYALTKLTAADEAKIAALVKKAAG